MMLSEHFTYEEMTFSEYAERNDVLNAPDEEAFINLQALCVQVLEPIRSKIGKPVIISSGFRNQEVNAAIGGSRFSQHMKGQAADFVIPGLSTHKIVDAIITLEGLVYDQVIEEFGRWVHISYNRFGNNRREALHARRLGGSTVYAPFIAPNLRSVT